MGNIIRPIQRAHLIRQVEYAFSVVKNLQSGEDPEGNRIDSRDNRLSELIQVMEEARQFVLQYAKQEGNPYILQQAQTIPPISPQQFQVSTNRTILEQFADRIPYLWLLFLPSETKKNAALEKFLNAAHPAFNRILSVLKQPGLEEFFQQVN